MGKTEQLMAFDALLQEVVKDTSCQLRALLHDLVTPTQYFLLKIMAANETCKAADIAHILDISPSAATTILDRLYKHGWIERHRSDTDRRVVWLRLTEQGARLLSDIETRRLRLMETRFDGISEQEIEQVCKVLKKILRSAVDGRC